MLAKAIHRRIDGQQHVWGLAMPALIGSDRGDASGMPREFADEDNVIRAQWPATPWLQLIYVADVFLRFQVLTRPA